MPSVVGSNDHTDTWVAVAEFERPVTSRPLLVGDVEALIEHLREWHPSGLWSSDRYAIQIYMPARTADQALRWALAYHLDGARAVGLLPVKLLRVEVLTVEEHVRAFQVADLTGTHVAPRATKAVLCDELYLATRSLHAATTPADLIDAVIGFVTAVGGRVELGAARVVPGMIEMDLTIEGDGRFRASAEAFSVAGLILERSLPDLLADARHALTRLPGAQSRN